MTDITILAAITKPTIDKFVMPVCRLSGCNCVIKMGYPSSARAALHSNVGDTLTVGTVAQCNAGTKDIIRSVADALITLGWAENA